MRCIETFADSVSSVCRRLVARLAAAASPEAKQGFPEPTKERQVLRFREPQSDVDVVLVGTMHYNPASISLAANTVKDLVDKDRLGALVLETCPKREDPKLMDPRPLSSPPLRSSISARSSDSVSLA